MLFIFYHHYKLEIAHLKERVFLEMKNYALDLEGERFDIDIVPAPVDQRRYYQLLENRDTLYILVPLPGARDDALKILYPSRKLQKETEEIFVSFLIRFGIFSLFASVIALIFSWYVLHPMREALGTLEGFMKDLIHDLNTPLSAILVNLKMMRQNEETQSIEHSARAIAALHRNLESYLNEHTAKRSRFALCRMLRAQSEFFHKPHQEITLRFECPQSVVVFSDPDAFERIVQNLLSNAFKYNKPGGYVAVSYRDSILTLSNTVAETIRRPDRLFERFYKENKRGLGLGLHIVRKLCETLDISIDVRYDRTANVVMFRLDLSKLTQN